MKAEAGLSKAQGRRTRTCEKRAWRRWGETVASRRESTEQRIGARGEKCRRDGAVRAWGRVDSSTSDAHLWGSSGVSRKKPTDRRPCVSPANNHSRLLGYEHGLTARVHPPRPAILLRVAMPAWLRPSLHRRRPVQRRGARASGQLGRAATDVRQTGLPKTQGPFLANVPPPFRPATARRRTEPPARRGSPRRSPTSIRWRRIAAPCGGSLRCGGTWPDC